MSYFDVYLGKSIINELRNTILIFFFLILLTLIFFFSGCSSDTSPSDINDCTRIEISYPRSTLDYFLPGSLKNVLNTEEKKYINSIEYFKLTDKNKIKSFASDMSLGKYNGRMWVRYHMAVPSTLLVTITTRK